MSEILLAPIITEKAISKISEDRYTFRVATKANKPQIAQAITDAYKVQVIKVNIINKKGDKVFVRGKHTGTKKNWKKAIVTLKKGQKIPGYEEK